MLTRDEFFALASALKPFAPESRQRGTASSLSGAGHSVALEGPVEAAVPSWAIHEMPAQPNSLPAEPEHQAKSPTHAAAQYQVMEQSALLLRAAPQAAAQPAFASMLETSQTVCAEAEAGQDQHAPASSKQPPSLIDAQAKKPPRGSEAAAPQPAPDLTHWQWLGGKLRFPRRHASNRDIGESVHVVSDPPAESAGLSQQSQSLSAPTSLACELLDVQTGVHSFHGSTSWPAPDLTHWQWLGGKLENMPALNLMGGDSTNGDPGKGKLA
jgi:hypothetical protein